MYDNPKMSQMYYNINLTYHIMWVQGYKCPVLQNIIMYFVYNVHMCIYLAPALYSQFIAMSMYIFYI